MGITFISKVVDSVPPVPDVIILWSGAKANIPDGWVYYSEAVGCLISGATTPNVTPVGADAHTHTYAAGATAAGEHTHTVTLSAGAPLNASIPGLYYQSGQPANGADRYHSNHPNSKTISTAAAHPHSLLTTGSGANLPPTVKLYFIRKT